MNKHEFTTLVKSKGEYASLNEADKAIKAVVDAISDVVANQDSINIPGLGTFTTALQKGRTGTVPGTQHQYQTQDKQVPRFKASSILKDRVSAKGENN